MKAAAKRAREGEGDAADGGGPLIIELPMSPKSKKTKEGESCVCVCIEGVAWPSYPAVPTFFSLQEESLDGWVRGYRGSVLKLQSTVDPHLSCPDGLDRICEMAGYVKQCIFNGDNRQFYLMHSKTLH